MRLVLVGLWVTLVALGAAYGAGVVWPARTAAAASSAAAPTVLQQQKTRVINVPLVADGAVQGFVAMQFTFTVDGTALKGLQIPPEVYLLDEAFRTIYEDKTLDFRHLEKYDLGTFTRHLVESTNAHLGAPLVKDVLIEDFSYITKSGDPT